MSKILISQNLFNNINYDMEKSEKKAADDALKQPTVLIVFSNSNFQAAIYNLVKSLEKPWSSNAIATVLLEESVKRDFIHRLQLRLKPINKEDIVKNEETTSNAGADCANPSVADLAVDFARAKVGDSDLSSLVTLHTFRTGKEAVSLISKDSIKFPNVSIWHENHSYAFGLVAELKSKVFYINCYNVSMTLLEESIEQGKSFVVMDKNYHYETMPCDGIQKSIVFPIAY